MSVPKYGTYNDYQETSRLLENSTKLARETDATAGATVAELHSQGSQLKESEGYVSIKKALGLNDVCYDCERLV
jgi:hypothetical protein